MNTKTNINMFMWKNKGKKCIFFYVNLIQEMKSTAQKIMPQNTEFDQMHELN